MMTNKDTLIREAYSAFNARDIDSALALMTENVRWPKASEGGQVVGKKEIRAYWSRQWQAFDPYVTPTKISDRPDGKTEVTVRQLVKSLNGDVLSDSEVCHLYTITDGLIEGMDLKDEGATDGGPSTAFAKH
jgi:ketosteroid isomerase-like protein